MGYGVEFKRVGFIDTEGLAEDLWRPRFEAAIGVGIPKGVVHSCDKKAAGDIEGWKDSKALLSNLCYLQVVLVARVQVCSTSLWAWWGVTAAAARLNRLWFHRLEFTDACGSLSSRRRRVVRFGGLGECRVELHQSFVFAKETIASYGGSEQKFWQRMMGELNTHANVLHLSPRT